MRDNLANLDDYLNKIDNLIKDSDDLNEDSVKEEILDVLYNALYCTKEISDSVEIIWERIQW